MTNADAHRFHTEIRSGSVTARPIDRSEYVEVEHSQLFTDSALEKIRFSFSTLGFLTVRMPPHFVEGHAVLHATNKKFFAVDDELKRSIVSTSFSQPDYSNIGYFPMNTEKAQSHDVPDRKEFIHIGRPPCKLKGRNPLYTDIPWPTELRDIASEYRSCYSILLSYAEDIFLAIAQAHQLDIAYAKSIIQNGNSILRNIHYPPIEANSNAMRAAPHHGMNLIGMQVRSTHPGLQFCTHYNDWVYLDDWTEDLVTINIGRMMAYLLNGRAKPTLHRVINDLDGSGNEHRYTSVMFFHGHPDAELKPLLGDQNLAPLTIGEWTKNRLRDIRIK